MCAKRIVLMFSGGIESVVIAALARRDHADAVLHGIFVDYGQSPAASEARAVTRAARRYGIVVENVGMAIPFLDDSPMMQAAGGKIVAGGGGKETRAHIVPYRNLMFLGICASYATIVGATELWTGFDYCPENAGAARDKSPAFARAMDHVLAEASEGVKMRVITPLQGNVKADTIHLGESMLVDWEGTWSCYNDGLVHCGECGSCLQRKQGFEVAGMVDPTQYAAG